MGAFSVTLGWTLQPYLQEGLQRNRVGGACDYRPLIYLCVNVWVWGHLYVSVSMRREVVVVCYFDVCVLLEMKNLSFYLSKCAWLRSTAVDFVIFLFYKQKSINFFSFCLTEHLFCQKKKKKVVWHQYKILLLTEKARRTRSHPSFPIMLHKQLSLKRCEHFQMWDQTKLRPPNNTDKNLL